VNGFATVIRIINNRTVGVYSDLRNGSMSRIQATHHVFQML